MSARDPAKPSSQADQVQQAQPGELFDPLGLTRRYRELADERSPEPLDQRILAAANRQHRNKLATLRPWLSIAASISVLGLSAVLVWHAQQQPPQEHPKLVSPMSQTASRPEVPSERASSASSPSEMPAAEAAASVDAANAQRPAQGAVLDQQPTENQGFAQSDVVSELAEAQSKSERESSDSTRDRSVSAAPPASLGAAEATAEARREPSKPLMSAPMAPTAAARGVAETSLEVPEGPQQATVDKLAAPGAQASAQANAVAGAGPLEPKAWLKQIRALVREGHQAEARVSLRAWRERHPRLDVPDDLRFLLAPDEPGP